MNRNYSKVTIFILVNVVTAIGFLLGFSEVYTIFTGLLDIFRESASGITASLQSSWAFLTSLNEAILFGAIFCAGVLAFDLTLIISWMRSFRITETKKCRNCSHKLIREQRQALDRLLSYIIPVRRYRCVGCGSQYLMTKKTEKVVRKQKENLRPTLVRVHEAADKISL